jgi:hypothetical protein
MPSIPRPLGLVCLALLFAAVFVVALPGQMVWQRVLMDAGHGPVFAAMAVVLLLLQAPAGATTAASPARRPASASAAVPGVVDRRPRPLRQYLVAFVIAVAIGALTEWLQRYVPNRNVSLGDLLHDAMGAALGLGTLALVERVRAGTQGTGHAPWLWALVLATLLGLAWSPLQCARAYATRFAAFPTLAPLGPLADDYFIAAHDAALSHAPLPARWRQAGEGDAALRLDFAAAARPAFELTEFEHDWRGRETLALDVTNPGAATATFVLRILDARHDWSHEDRLNLPVVVPPHTRTTLRVSLAAVEHAPAHRTMDLAAVANVMLFATVPSGNESFYVSRVWLE